MGTKGLGGGTGAPPPSRSGVVRSLTLRVPAYAGNSVLQSHSQARHRHYITRGAPVEPGGVSMINLHVG